jgi:hypothetical protein
MNEPSPTQPSGDRATGSRPKPSSTLNPHVVPFSPSSTPNSGAAAEDLSDWLLFSPSSSEGRSGRPSSVSTASFTDTVCRGSNVLHFEAGVSSAQPQTQVAPSRLVPTPEVAHHDGKAPLKGMSACSILHSKGKVCLKLQSRPVQPGNLTVSWLMPGTPFLCSHLTKWGGGGARSFSALSSGTASIPRHLLPVIQCWWIWWAAFSIASVSIMSRRCARSLHAVCSVIRRGTKPTFARGQGCRMQLGHHRDSHGS